MMRCWVALIAAVAGLAAEAPQAVKTYCSGCHNGIMKSPSGVLLPYFDATSISENRETWARAYRQIQANAMPPFGAPRPDRATTATMLAAIEQGLGTKPPAAAGGQEIAERLATLLWNSAPDAALMGDAGRLSDPAVLERHIKRMLADDRAQALVSQFFLPWLQLNELAKADPSKRYFPDYDPSLRDSFTKETELFLLSQLREDRDPVELWSANYTFLNEQLAKQYGIGTVTGAQFRRVTLDKPERDGLLGQGSVLMVTSRHQHGWDAGYTTPATRAKWVRMHYFGIAPPDPFPGALPV